MIVADQKADGLLKFHLMPITILKAYIDLATVIKKRIFDLWL